MEAGGLASQRAMDELGLPESLLAPLEEEEAPTTFLQASIWAEGRTGVNLLVKGESGTETTVAFAVLLLKQLLDRGVVSAVVKPWEGCRREFGDGASPEGRSEQGADSNDLSRRAPHLHALVVTRNRDIASNVMDAVVRLGQCLDGLSVAALMGGVPVAENLRTLAGGCHIAVGTPGRVRYLIGKGALQPATARTLVLESADWLLAPVFQEDVRWISGKFPESKQVLAFSTVDASVIKPALSELVGVTELKGLGGNSSNSGAQDDANVPRSPNPIENDGSSSSIRNSGTSPPLEPSAEAVARAAVVGATASAFLERPMSVGGGGGRRSPSSVLSTSSTSSSSSRASRSKSRTKKSTSVSNFGEKKKIEAAMEPNKPAEAQAAMIAKERDSLRVSTMDVASSLSTSTAHTAAISPNSQRSSSSSVPAGGNSNSNSTERPRSIAISEVSTAASDGASPPPPPPYGSGSRHAPVLHPQIAASIASSSSGGGSSVRGHDAEEDDGRAWPRDGSGNTSAGGTGGGDVADGEGGGGPHQTDHASLDLLSPGAFKKESDGVARRGVGVPGSEAPNSNSSGGVHQMSAAEMLKSVEVVSVPPKGTTKSHEGAQYALADEVTSVTAGSGSSTLEAWNIPPVLVAALEADGVTEPTPLQASVWTAGREGNRPDLLVHGRPGDETATAYAVIVLERVWQRYPPPSEARTAPAWDGDVKKHSAETPPEPLELQALVLTRTRDMAASVTDTLVRLGRGIPGLTVATLIGGVAVAENAKALAHGCHVAVGTPGRVRFLMKKGLLRSNSAQTLVLDSADWLMAPVFQEDVGWVGGRFPKDKQVLAFSGADPAAIEAGLKDLVGSSYIMPIGGSSSCAASAAAAVEIAAATAAVVAATRHYNDDYGHCDGRGVDNGAAARAADEAVAVESRSSDYGMYDADDMDDVPAQFTGPDASRGAPQRGGGAGAEVKVYRVDELRTMDPGESSPAPAAAAAAAAMAAVAGAVAAARGEGDIGAGARGVGSGGGAHRAFSAPRGFNVKGGATFATRVRLSRENQLYGTWCRHLIGGVGAAGRR